MLIELRDGNRLDPETVTVVATFQDWGSLVDHANANPGDVRLTCALYIARTDMVGLACWLDLHGLHTYVVAY
jgi:hypothetical protein